ncbi:putative transcription factor [Nymphaea thermarum]|nr:putative transcription factor [Nymphaea thermarum]
MDLVFMLEEESRSAFIRWVVQTLGCRYICLWSYQPYLPKIPGLAFTEGKAYLRLGEASLQSMARTDTQRQFYQGAGIKTAVFLACRSGEVEIGSSSSDVSSDRALEQINLEMEEIRSLLTGELFKQFQLVNPAHPLESSRASSSSSSLLSFSIGSPEYSSMLINLPNPQSFQESMRNQASILRSTTIIILRGINQQRLQAQLGENKPASSQLSHVMSERKRREKLNESFLALRALLPLGTKVRILNSALPLKSDQRDKASVLTSTREYMTALREQVRELESRNRVLEAQMFLLPTSNGKTGGREEESSAGEGREEIRVVEVSSALDEREIELIVHKQIDLMYLVLKLLGCIKDMGNVALLAVTADVQKLEQQQQSSVALRLKIRGKDWSKRDFEERISREFGG